MKKIIIGLALLFSLTAFANPPAIKPNILKNFKEDFPKAQNISWFTGTMKYEVQESDYSSTEGNFKYFEVNFLENEVQFKVYYTEEGKIFSTIKYYDKEDLSPFILEKINEQYYGKSILGITEVEDGTGLFYQVILQDQNDQHWYVLNSDSEGNMQIIKKYKCSAKNNQMAKAN